MKEIIKFPESFLWGTATSAYQVEGGIENCDWSGVYPASRACDHYHRYEEDFDLLKSLHQNAYRFSIEWSRIEPEEGRFDEKEIEHYRQVFKALRDRRIKTMVTLFHFTLPKWLAEIGGFENRRSVFYFSRFAEKMLIEYKDLVDFWVTINEPIVYVFSIWPLIRGWSRNKKGESFSSPKISRLPLILLSSLKILRNQIKSHQEIYKKFHDLNKSVLIGLAQGCAYFEPLNSHSFFDHLLVRTLRFINNGYFLNQTEKYLDFIGLNYYFHFLVGLAFLNKDNDRDKSVSDIGWEVFPEGIYHCLAELKKYRLPIYITENGVADAGDKIRKGFIKDHLFWIAKAIEGAVDVRGYFHWSLIDNFEWEKGFYPRFGLIEIDYQTMERKIRPSSFYFAEVCKNNQLSLE